MIKHETEQYYTWILTNLFKSVDKEKCKIIMVDE